MKRSVNLYADYEPSYSKNRNEELPSCSKDSVQQREETEDDAANSDNQTLDGNRRVVASHYNQLRETGRSERMKSNIFHMRNFNNWIKSMLITEYMNKIRSTQRVGDHMRVLDMCCGKGGDLLKWSKANITHLICTDIAEVSVEQCKTRYNEFKANAEKRKFGQMFTAEFFHCDATLVRLRERYKDKSMKLNLVSCQFAFHYSFESLSQADCMVRNAAECLQAGGYFIATLPDANEIMRRLQASDNKRSFGNKIYNVEFNCDTEPPPLFGGKYMFHLENVVDCPEFLVHFPTLVKICRKYGLQLDRRTTFANYYTENAESGMTLLQRMNGLETVYRKNVRDNDDYAHIAGETLESDVCNTLSRSEWEAISKSFYRSHFNY